MEEEKLDMILNHLYGELEPNTEEEFLKEVSTSKLLNSRLKETRQLLTAYRLSPMMEPTDAIASRVLQKATLKETAKNENITKPLEKSDNIIIPSAKSEFKTIFNPQDKNSIISDNTEKDIRNNISPAKNETPQREHSSNESEIINNPPFLNQSSTNQLHANNVEQTVIPEIIPDSEATTVNRKLELNKTKKINSKTNENEHKSIETPSTLLKTKNKHLGALATAAMIILGFGAGIYYFNNSSREDIKNFILRKNSSSKNISLSLDTGIEISNDNLNKLTKTTVANTPKKKNQVEKLEKNKEIPEIDLEKFQLLTETPVNQKQENYRQKTALSNSRSAPVEIIEVKPIEITEKIIPDPISTSTFKDNNTEFSTANSQNNILESIEDDYITEIDLLPPVTRKIKDSENSINKNLTAKNNSVLSEISDKAEILPKADEEKTLEESSLSTSDNLEQTVDAPKSSITIIKEDEEHFTQETATEEVITTTGKTKKEIVPQADAKPTVEPVTAITQINQEKELPPELPEISDKAEILPKADEEKTLEESSLSTSDNLEQTVDAPKSSITIIKEDEEHFTQETATEEVITTTGKTKKEIVPQADAKPTVEPVTAITQINQEKELPPELPEISDKAEILPKADEEKTLEESSLSTSDNLEQTVDAPKFSITIIKEDEEHFTQETATEEVITTTGKTEKEIVPQADAKPTVEPVTAITQINQEKELPPELPEISDKAEILPKADEEKTLEESSLSTSDNLEQTVDAPKFSITIIKEDEEHFTQETATEEVITTTGKTEKEIVPQADAKPTVEPVTAITQINQEKELPPELPEISDKAEILPKADEEKTLEESSLSTSDNLEQTIDAPKFSITIIKEDEEHFTQETATEEVITTTGKTEKEIVPQADAKPTVEPVTAITQINQEKEPPPELPEISDKAEILPKADEEKTLEESSLSTSDNLEQTVDAPKSSITIIEEDEEHFTQETIQSHPVKTAEDIAQKLKIVEPLLLAEGHELYSISESPQKQSDKSIKEAQKFLISKEKTVAEISYNDSDSIDTLLKKSRELYNHNSLIQALFGVEDALVKSPNNSQLVEALTLKARIELKLKDFSQLKETISKLRPLSPLDATALQMLYKSSIKHTIEEKQQEYNAARPYVKEEISETRKLNIYSPKQAEKIPLDKKQKKKRRFNPTTDTYYKRR